MVALLSRTYAPVVAGVAKATRFDRATAAFLLDFAVSPARLPLCGGGGGGGGGLRPAVRDGTTQRVGTHNQPQKRPSVASRQQGDREASKADSRQAGRKAPQIAN